jgi:hypothetical protein
MSTLTTGQITIAEMAKSHTEDGKYLPLYDTLRRRSTLFSDMQWVQANMPDKHRIPRRTIAGTSTATALYEGVAATKINPEQIDEYLMKREDYSEVDVRAKDLYPDILQERDDQDTMKMADMAYDASVDLIYADRSATIRKIDGLAKRMKSLVADQVVDAGGSASRTSIYFVAWDKRFAYGIYPRGSTTFGVKTEDMGRQQVRDSTGKIYYVYQSHLEQDYGLAIQDPKGIARIANIDDTNADPWTNYTLQTKVNRIMANLNLGGTKLYAYMKASQFALFQNFVQNKTNIWYKVDEFGAPVVEFMGISWRIFDGIVNTETAVA